MAKTLQHRRGTTTELASVTGAIGEIFMDTDKKTLVVMDGTTPGGKALAVEGSGGGSGASYDQSLNTTDDVVFDSGLVGNVSIIGNEIAGVDSYGNADTLVVSSEMQVNVGELSTFSVVDNTGTLHQWNSYDPGLSGALALNGLSNENITKLTSLAPGTVVQYNNLTVSGWGTYSGTFTKAADSWSSGNTFYLPINFDGFLPELGNSLQFNSQEFFNINFTWSEDGVINALSVTETGVNVNGAFTVNGQPISTGGGSGASYDQSLNTTDDVVFNSGLVGNVSIIDNTIGGVDSYGNADTLVVDGDLSVTIGNQTTTTYAGSELSWNSAQVYSNGGDGYPAVAGAGAKINFNGYGQMNQLTNTILSSLTVGQTITVYEYGTGTPHTYTIFSIVSGAGMMGDSYWVYATETVTGMMNLDVNYGMAVTTSSSTTPLQVTDAGVSLNNINATSDISVAIDTTSTVDTVWTSSDFAMMSNSSHQNGSSQIELSLMGNPSAFLASLKIGDKLTFQGSTYGGTTQFLHTVTLTSLPTNYMANYYLDVAEVNTLGTQINLTTPVTVTTPTGSIETFTFDTTGTFTTPSVLATDALIGDVSIVGNNISGVDSYGNPAELAISSPDVVFDTNLNLTVDTRVSSTETISGGMAQFNIAQAPSEVVFYYSPMGPVNFDTTKFKTGTSVTLVSSMYGNSVIELTSEFLFDNMNNRYEATFNLISGPAQNNASSVIITNSSGDLANYGFDDQGTFSTKALLIDGTAPSLLTNNIDGSKSIVVDSFVETTETISGGMNSFNLSSSTSNTFYYSPMGTVPFDTTKFRTGTLVTLTGMMGTVVIELTSNFAFDNMDNRWESTYTLISGIVGSGVNSQSATITNTSGAVANYSFDDQGVLTAPTVSTNSLLINGSVPALLTNNVDGSKSVEVDSTTETFYAGDSLMMDPSKVYWSNAAWQWSQPTIIQFNSPSAAALSLFQSLAAGTKIKFAYYDSGPMTTIYYTVTLVNFYQDAGSTYMMQVVESNPNAQSMQTINFNPMGVTVTVDTFNDYNFGLDGALTVPSLIADEALIGDVSIVGNTIAGVDSYGLADTLIVDGDLQVTGDLSSPSALSLTVGGGPITYDVDTPQNQSATWSGNTLTFSSTMDSSALNVLLALPIGSHITFSHYMYGSFDVVTTSTVTAAGSGNSVDVSKSPSDFGWSNFSFDENNVQFVYPRPTATYGFGTDGSITANGSPVGSGGGLTTTIIDAFNDLPSVGYTVNVSTYKRVKVSGYFGSDAPGTQPLIKVFKNTTTLEGPEVGTGWGRYWRRPGSSWSAADYAPNTIDDIYFGMNLPATQGYFELEMEGSGSGAMCIRSSTVTNNTSVPDQGWNGYYTTNCDGDLYIQFNNSVGAVSKVTIVGYK